eukprot:TRINITY_DN4627_c0_g1_i1.p1 TRINITY_DN4627_c0_g1~~TRINITY_DN4627_c0_g1_i1.p1  ORF type:complete len:427 (-),score=107.93 TRINITY_DN4627_c0_g1_i1:32-1312(-)
MDSPFSSPALRKTLGDVVEENQVLENIYDDVDFQFDLSGVHSDATNLLQNFVQKEVIKKVFKDRYKKLSNIPEVISSSPHIMKVKDNVKKTLQGEALKKAYAKKKKQLEEKISAPPFLRTSDKVAFTVGILVMAITEFVLLKKPENMPLWYTSLIFPLMLLRYYFYNKAKYQYFMLDFCYFAQVVLLTYLYVTPTNANIFQLVFGLSNGPLAVGAVMWRNSLVFHDLDKLTSVFIHLFPPIVTFCLRWYPTTDNRAVCIDDNCSIGFFNTFIFTMACYVFWQIAYLIQTEIVDKKKIEKDREIMTSARWLGHIKPHPVWKFLKKKYNLPDSQVNVVLVGTQFIYTILTLLPIIPIYNSFHLHAMYLALVCLICVWNGANFYFEIFTQTYTKRVQRMLKDQADQNKDIAHQGKVSAEQKLMESNQSK